MKIKIKSILIISLILFIVAVLAFAGSWFFTRQTIGFTTLSLTQADLRSSSEYLDGKQWILTVRQGGLAQNAEGTFTAEQVGEEYSGNEQPTKDFTINLDYAKQQCEYVIKENTNKPSIYTFYEKEWYCLVSPSESVAKTHCNSGDMILYGKISGEFKCVCGGANNVANYIGDFENPSIRSILDVSVNSNGQSYTKTIDTLGETRGSLGNNAYVVWQGNLDTGKACLSQTPYLPIYYSGQWKSFSSQNYASYSSQYDNVQTTVYTLKNNPTRTSVSSYKGAIEVLQERVTDLVNNQKSFGTIDKPSEINNAIAILYLKDEYVAYPVLTFYVKASWIGIYTPIAQPSISSASSDCFTTGTEGVIKTTIKNIGDESGSINVWATCVNPFTSTSNKELYLDSGKSQTVYIPISATTLTQDTKTCVIHAQSIDKEVTKSVSVCVKAPPGVCTPNEKWCEGLDVYGCDATGQIRTKIATCQKTCTRISNTEVACETNGTIIPPSPGFCEDKIFGLVPSSYTTTEKCTSFWCELGLAKKTKIGECTYDWTIVYIFAVLIIIIITLIIVFASKKNQTSNTKFRRKK
jgi:hypothetical protein